MSITKEFVQNVRDRLSEEPGIPTARLARELGADEASVITALPVNMRKKARPEDFGDIWAYISDQASLPQVSKEELGYIWFVERPDQSDKKRSVQFFDKNGERLFSVYLSGPNENTTYSRLCERFGVTPAPKIQCKGCGKCTCGGKHKAHTH